MLLESDEMDMKKYFDIDLRTTLLFALLGSIVGYLSFIIKSNTGSLVMMIVFLLAAKFLGQKLLKEKKDSKWWLGNGVIIYIFVWFITWTVFYNVLV